MPEKVTLELPEDVADQVRAVAARTQRSFEDVLVDWIRHAGSEPVLELLPDNELLAVCDSQMSPDQEEELSELLERKREGTLSLEDKCQLDELMKMYRAGLVRKAQAIKAAVARGLRPRLN